MGIGSFTVGKKKKIFRVAAEEDAAPAEEDAALKKACEEALAGKEGEKLLKPREALKEKLNMHKAGRMRQLEPTKKKGDKARKAASPQATENVVALNPDLD